MLSVLQTYHRQRLTIIRLVAERAGSPYCSNYTGYNIYIPQLLCSSGHLVIQFSVKCCSALCAAEYARSRPQMGQPCPGSTAQCGTCSGTGQVSARTCSHSKTYAHYYCSHNYNSVQH